MKTRNFELKDIEAGCKFITRGGKEVKNLHLGFKNISFFGVGGEVDEEQEWWSKGGKYSVFTDADNMDLMTVVEEDQSISDFNGEHKAKIINTINDIMADQPQGIKEYIESNRPDFPFTMHEGKVDGKEWLNKVEAQYGENHDPVNKPSHYTDGKIEVIDFIDDKNFDFCIGNAIKYLSRAGKKENEIEDLEKAVWYIQHKINKLKNG